MFWIMKKIIRYTPENPSLVTVETASITAAGVVPCGGPKKSPRTLSIVQIIFSFLVL